MSSAFDSPITESNPYLRCAGYKSGLGCVGVMLETQQEISIGRKPYCKRCAEIFKHDNRDWFWKVNYSRSKFTKKASRVEREKG